MQGGDTNSVVIPIAAIAIVVGCAWCALLFLIGILTGWRKLAGRFKKQSEPYGDVKTAGTLFYTVYMRYWTHYSSVMRLTAAADALYLSVIFPFSIGHPPLRIPWNEIEIAETKRILRTYVVLTLGSEERIPVRISERMARNLGIFSRIPASSASLGQR